MGMGSGGGGMATPRLFVFRRNLLRARFVARAAPHPNLWGALAGAPRSGGAKLALRETPPSPPAGGEGIGSLPCGAGEGRGGGRTAPSPTPTPAAPRARRNM